MSLEKISCGMINLIIIIPMLSVISFSFFYLHSDISKHDSFVLACTGLVLFILLILVNLILRK